MKPKSKLGKYSSLIRLGLTTILGAVSIHNAALADSENGFSELKKECFRDHLREAIAMNKFRRPLYANASNYQSLEISNRLIAGEQLAKFSSYLFYNFDHLAKPFQEKGINIVCDEFVPMNLTPNFVHQSPAPFPRIESFVEIDPYIVRRSIVRAMDKGYPETVTVVRHWISKIENSDSRFNCMTRHLLESVGRIAKLAPKHIRTAKRLNLPSPSSLSESMISSHLLMLPESVSLDALAAPLQASGIPILCQDVPPIHF